MIRDFTEFTTDLKIRGINPGFHIMKNEAPTALENYMTTMDTKYQLVLLSNQIYNNTEGSINNFKNHFIAGL